ncbi:hypothetical protein [Marivita sp. XM-24bin2]|uniref:hypothetical protein n=1 Tax=Marivita sp. XM-24bin2 TaxID=2133951 RepID=UPI0025B7B635|nr:hypothetical protein [Marivita sp. XM-24bin2]
MARDRERHANTGRRGSTPAVPDDLSSGTARRKGATLRFTNTATAQPDPPGGSQPHGRRSLNERIENALCVVAELLEHDETYLPIFLRLEAERDKLDTRRAALDRARAFLRETHPRSRSGPAPRP